MSWRALCRYGRDLGLLWLLTLLLQGGLHAATCSAASSTVNLPSVSVPSGTPVGTLLGSPTSVTMSFTCNFSFGDSIASVTVQAGEDLAPLDASNVAAGPGIRFATNVPGIALLVTGTPVQASSNACLQCGPDSKPGFQVGSMNTPFLGGTQSVAETFTLQLVKTGNVVPGTISGLQLIPFWWYYPGHTASVPFNASLSLGGGTSVSVPGCAVVAPADLAVSLPAISTSALTGVGSTAGRTGFTLRLTCPSGVTLAFAMQSSNPASSVKGLSNPVAGGASNVGVQLLDGSFNPVSVQGDAQPAVRTVGAGMFVFPYYAQYYQTAATVGAGKVSATVTYTVTYP